MPAEHAAVLLSATVIILIIWEIIHQIKKL